ncbi:MAG: hypothetical protein P4M14_05840 [Gammaproteobacteria bacterium]|nr:hypothetical protein [Gammaproteobacteria bacterium]
MDRKTLEYLEERAKYDPKVNEELDRLKSSVMNKLVAMQMVILKRFAKIDISNMSDNEIYQAEQNFYNDKINSLANKFNLSRPDVEKAVKKIGFLEFLQKEQDNVILPYIKNIKQE